MKLFHYNWVSTMKIPLDTYLRICLTWNHTFAYIIDMVCFETSTSRTFQLLTYIRFIIWEKLFFIFEFKVLFCAGNRSVLEHVSVLASAAAATFDLDVHVVKALWSFLSPLTTAIGLWFLSIYTKCQWRQRLRCWFSSRSTFGYLYYFVS